MSVITIGAVQKAGSIPGNGCLGIVGDVEKAPAVSGFRKQWIFKNDPTPSLIYGGSEYPVAMGIDRMMEMYWRWRKLEVSYSLTTSQCSETAVVSDLDRKVANDTAVSDLGIMAKGVPWNVIYTTDPWHNHSQGAPAPTAPFPQTYIDLKIRIFDHLGTNVYYSAPNYHPHFVFELDLFHLADENNGLYAPCVDARTENLHGNSHPIDLTIELSTQSITVPLYMFDSATTGSITLKATEYWPHQKLDGSPKWNTATGLKLP